MSKQSGFAIIEGLFIIVVIVGLVGGGYFIWQRQQSKPVAATSGNNTADALDYNSPAITTPSVSAVTGSTGLDSALQALNATNVTAGSTDSAQLNTQASGL
jgi:hypothetical protein